MKPTWMHLVQIALALAALALSFFHPSAATYAMPIAILLLGGLGLTSGSIMQKKANNGVPPTEN